jgi:predicted DCC family thiol-disulfide oxidoreductase YuxK
MHADSRDSDRQTLVFYDGACAACRAEMKIIRRWDRTDRIRMIDIAAPEYDARAWPVPLADMNALLHVRLPDGAWRNGMAATRHIYRAVGRGWMMAPTGWPLLARLFDRAYAWFARHRLPISAFFGLRRCSDGTCRVAR